MREPGFYWVKYCEVDSWQVAEFNYWVDADNYFWNLTGCDISFQDEEFSEIDERRIIREEHLGYIETSLGVWTKIHEETYDKLLSEITQAINDGDDFIEKLLEDDELQKLVSKAILAKAAQLAKQ